MDGRVTGRAMVRPVRIGLVFEPSAEMLRLAVEQATLLWAGQYQPFFRPGDLDRIERLSRRLGVDVLLALDRSGASEEAAALDGYQWQGHDDWGPLAPARDYVNNRLLGPERLLDELPRDSRVLPDWAAGDPLDDLFPRLVRYLRDQRSGRQPGEGVRRAGHRRGRGQRARNTRLAASSCRTLPKVNERGKDSSVDGARIP
jgi:hypothetical protein